MRKLRLVLASLFSTLLRRARSGPRLPSWSFTFEWVVELLRRNWSEMRSWDHERVRREVLNTPMPNSAVRKVRTTETRFSGVRCLFIEPPEARSDVVILYFHGGSYLFGSPETHLDIGSRFALAAGARVLLPEYRLAPEHPYPAALDDAVRVFRSLAGSGALPGALPTQVALAGESAGGNLALALALALADSREPLPRAVALLSPWLDLSASSPSTRTAPHDYGDREMLRSHARMFAGDIPLDDPRLSLLHRRLEGLPPLLVQVGGAERLHDEAVLLERRATEARVDVTLEVLLEMPHAPQLIAEWCPLAQASIERAALFLAGRSTPLTRGPPPSA